MQKRPHTASTFISAQPEVDPHECPSADYRREAQHPEEGLIGKVSSASCCRAATGEDQPLRFRAGE